MIERKKLRVTSIKERNRGLGLKKERMDKEVIKKRGKTPTLDGKSKTF
jgi:hypothetical protein